jgi:hypothetical protein
MAPPEVTQEAADEEVAEIERLRLAIAEERDSRSRAATDSVARVESDQRQAEIARLKTELAEEQRLTALQNSSSTLTEAQEAMRRADQQQRMLAAGQLVEEANAKVVEAQQKATGVDEKTVDKAIDESIKGAEKSAATLEKTATKADKVADKAASKAAGDAGEEK